MLVLGLILEALTRITESHYTADRRRVRVLSPRQSNKSCTIARLRAPDVSSVRIICIGETRNHKPLAQLRTQLKSRGTQTYETK
jgi:hypothetical protein